MFNPSTAEMRFDPARIFGAAFDLQPQVTPDNLHGLCIGADRGRLRDIVVAMRMTAGPLLVIADESRVAPPGISTKHVALNKIDVPNLSRFPGFKTLCTQLAGEHTLAFLEAWNLINEQEILPGTYRRIPMVSKSGGSVAGLLRLCTRYGLPDPQWAGDSIACLVRSVEDMNWLATYGWRVAGEEKSAAAVFSGSEVVVVADTSISLNLALNTVDPNHGPLIYNKIVGGLQGAYGWNPFATPLQTLISRADDPRLPILLEIAFAAAQRDFTSGDARLRTIVIDHEITEQAFDVIDLIARTGRKHSCSAMILSTELPKENWATMLGFTITSQPTGEYLEIDQHHRQTFSLAASQSLRDAHELLHRTQQDN